MYLITPEKRNGSIVGTLLNKPCYIYRVETARELEIFKDGVVCYNEASLFEVIEKVLKNANRGRIQRRVRGHSFGVEVLRSTENSLDD